MRDLRTLDHGREFSLAFPVVALLSLLLLFACSSRGMAQSGSDLMRRTNAPEIGRKLSFTVGDTMEIVARRPLLPVRSGALSYAPLLASVDLRARRPVSPSMFLQPRRVELTRFASAIYGGDLGAGTASALGGLGLVSGVWGEKTAGYLIGIGAVLGTLWGGTAGNNDSRFRFSIGANPEDERGAARVRR